MGKLQLFINYSTSSDDNNHQKVRLSALAARLSDLHVIFWELL